MRNLFLALLGLFALLGVATLGEALASAKGVGYTSPPGIEASLAGEICNSSRGVSASTLSPVLPPRRFNVGEFLPAGSGLIPIRPGFRAHKGEFNISRAEWWGLRASVLLSGRFGFLVSEYNLRRRWADFFLALRGGAWPQRNNQPTRDRERVEPRLDQVAEIDFPAEPKLDCYLDEPARLFPEPALDVAPAGDEELPREPRLDYFEPEIIRPSGKEVIQVRSRRKLPLFIASALILTGAAGGNAPIIVEAAALGAVALSCFDSVREFATSNPHSRLGGLIKSVQRKMGHLPVTTLTILPGGDGAIKVICKADGRDNIGLDRLAETFKLPPLGASDCMFIEANGVGQEDILQVAESYVEAGYRPAGARLLLRCFDEDNNETLGAKYVRKIGLLLGDLTNVRSYFSLGSAPSLKPFSIGTEGLKSVRGDGTEKEVLFFTGKAAKLYKLLDGTEGGLPTSEGAMEAIYGDKKPGQPRMILELEGDEEEYVLFKGNHASVAARAFPNKEGGWDFYTRGHFPNTDEGKKEWRKGYDFVLLEDDTPKGPSKSKVQHDSGIHLVNVKGRLSGWLIAQAPDSAGWSLVSYQVLSLLANINGEHEIAQLIEKLVARSVANGVSLVKADIQGLKLDSILGDEDAAKLKDWFGAKAPASAKAGRKNSFGFGANMSTGYVHMNTLIQPGHMVIGDEFGLSRVQVKRDKNKGQPAGEKACGGKNPILDSNQTWVGKAWRLNTLTRLREAWFNKNLTEEEKALLRQLLPTAEGEWGENLNWVLAYAPSLTRGSVLMNSEDVADLAGDDDGDMLWFSFRNNDVLKIFEEIKTQAQGNTAYSIENDKKAQLPSEIGSCPFVDMLTAEGDDLRAMVRFVMAPNKGQGPVGYLANLCTVLITFFEKVDNGQGGLKFENEWVELLQATLNLMQQTAIDMQKRIYATICLLRWAWALLKKENMKGRGLIPGFDFPALGYLFNKKGFDPNSFTKEEYKKALEEIEIPVIPHHYNGALLPAVTDHDSQYSIAALGSWLIWETISLVSTGKPCDWGEPLPKAAQGGLQPYKLAEQLQQGARLPDIIGDLDEPTKAKVEALWVEKPRELYAWKTQSKEVDFQSPAPPALEVNHRIALAQKAKHVPGEKPEMSFSKINAAISKVLHASFANAQEAKRYCKAVLDAFYLEAALAQNVKAQSEKFQSANERSGIEALRYLLEAFANLRSENQKWKKLAVGMQDALTPQVKMNKKDEAIAAISLLFAWAEMQEELWAYRMTANVVARETEERLQRKEKGGRTKVWQDLLGLTKQEASSIVRGGERSTFLKDPSFLPRCEAYLAKHYGENRFTQLKARSTWFIDEGLQAFVKAKDRQAIVESKRDILKALKFTIIRWTNERANWNTEGEVELEILLATFARGTAAWFQPILERIKEFSKEALTPEEREQVNKDWAAAKSKKDRKGLKMLRKLTSRNKKAELAGFLVKEVESLANPEVSASAVLNSLCGPNNPYAKEFVRAMKDNLGPVLNVERAWQRATPDQRETRTGWTAEIGYWKAYSSRDEHGENITTTRFYADSRVEWQLPAHITGGMLRTLLESGVSIYSLTKIPGRQGRTWRLFDAFCYKADPLSDWQLTNGMGHLVSMAVPTGADEERYARMDHIGLLQSEKEYYAEMDPESMTREQEDAQNGVLAELSRINELKGNSLMARWGCLWFPVTWGFKKRTYPGQLTQKRLQGRAWMALASLGREDERYHDQVERDEDGVRNVSTMPKPKTSNGRHMPWARKSTHDKFGDYSRDRQAELRNAGRLELDDTADLEPYSFGEAQNSWDEWLDFIERVAASGTGSSEALVMASLWFQSHAGRLMVMDPSNDIHDKDIAQKCANKLLSCPSFDARLHIEALLKSNTWPAPVWPKSNLKGATAFFDVIRTITKK